MNQDELKKKIKEARAKGVPDSVTFKYLNDRGLIPQEKVIKTATTSAPEAIPVAEEPAQGGGLFQALKVAANTRSASAKATQKRVMTGDLNPLSGNLRIAGQAAGLLGDVLGETVIRTGKALLPKAAEERIANTATKIFSSEPATKAIEMYKGFKEKHPEAAADLEAVVNIGSLVPAGKAVQIAAKPALRATGAAIKAGGEAVAVGGRITKAAGEAAYTAKLPIAAISPTVKEAEMLLSYKARTPFLQRVSNRLTGEQGSKPITRAQTAVERGISGTESQIGIEAKRANEKLWQESIAPAVRNSPKIVSKEELFAGIERKISDTVGPRRQELMDAYEAMKNDFKDTAEYISLEDAQKLKSTLDEFTPQKMFKGKDVANTYASLKNEVADEIRRITYDALDDVEIKKKYLDWANLKELEKVGVKAISEAGTKAGSGSLVRDLWNFAAVPLRTTGGKYIYKVGNVLEFVGEKGIKTFGEFLQSKGYQRPGKGMFQMIRETYENTPNKQGGFIGNKRTVTKKINKDDLNVMSDFTDYAAGSYKPDAKTAHELEVAASRIAEHYGIKQPKTLKGLANEFGRVLEEQGYKA